MTDGFPSDWGDSMSLDIEVAHVRVVNQGVGPAKIESAELVWKGTAYRTDQEFLEACCDFDPAAKLPVVERGPDQGLLKGGPLGARPGDQVAGLFCR